MKGFLKIIVALTFFINFSCSSDEVIEDKIVEVPSPNKIDLKINGLSPVHEITELRASFCCDNNFSITFQHFVATSNGLGYGGSAFNLSLDKNGNLNELFYKDYTNPNNEFYSPYFSPASTVSVENFRFIKNQLLKFKVKGKIFKRTYNFSAAPEFVNIDADIEIKEFITCICNSFTNTLTTNNSFNFNQITRTQQGADIRYLAYTNNGFQIEFKNFTQSLREMPLGVYAFNENSTSQRIDFRRFIGIPRVFYFSIIPQEWIKYETSGSFEILEKYQLNGQTITKVKFNLLSKENGVVIHNFNNGVFETSW